MKQKILTKFFLIATIIFLTLSFLASLAHAQTTYLVTLTTDANCTIVGQWTCLNGSTPYNIPVGSWTVYAVGNTGYIITNFIVTGGISVSSLTGIGTGQATLVFNVFGTGTVSAASQASGGGGGGGGGGAPLNVAAQPTSQSILVNSSATFTATATDGTPPYSFIWYNATSDAVVGFAESLTLTPITNGTTTYYCNVTDSALTTEKTNVVTLIASLTPPIGTYNYVLSGPYYDSGVASSDKVNITSRYVNGLPNSTLLSGTPITIASSTPITEMTWNASTALNYTRIINFRQLNATQYVNIYIPNPAIPFQQYNFPITDFAGMSHAYLQTSVGNGSAQNMVEQIDLNTTGTPTFVMQQYTTYTLTFFCDQGTYSQQFVAQNIYTNTLSVLAGAFPTSNLTYPTFEAQRLNSSLIGISYIDPSYTTNWLYITITHQFGTETVTDYITNNTGNTQTILWNSADSLTDYVVTASASIASNTSVYGTTPSWAISVSKTVSANAWLGVFDWLGQHVRTMPYTPTGWTVANGVQLTSAQIAEIVGSAIILLFLGIGSYRTAGAACILCWIASGFMIVLGWWGNGVGGAVGALPTFAFSGFIAIMVHMSEGKDTARET